MINRIREQARSHMRVVFDGDQLNSSQIGAWSEGFSMPRSS
jgi:hypothetical protein